MGSSSAGWLEVYAFSAIDIWAQAAEQANESDVDAVSDALRSNRFESLLGFVKFQPNGDAAMSPVIARAGAKDECPKCPKSGACPQSLMEAKDKCECPKSGACPQ